jgi:hypothetical protein
MPLTKPEEFGTDRAGYRVNDYCHHCYANGAFTEPDVPLPQMLDRCVKIMSGRGIMPETEARVLLADVMPQLKRWRAPRTKKVF